MAAYIYLKAVGKKNKENIIIADLNLGLEKGKSLALIGGNNSGKSMLLKVLAGIIKADFGTIFIDGEEFSPSNIRLRKKICYIPEYIDFLPNLSIFENLFIYIKLYKKISNNDAKNIILNWSDIFNFTDLLNLRVNQTQPSKLKIISLSRAFIHQPEILILDQPTKGLDLDKQMLFWEKVKTVLKSTTTIYASYDFTEIENYSDRISFLDNGKIQLNGSINEIMSQTQAYSYYKIIFKDLVQDDFKNILKENSDCYHLNIEGNEVEFYSPNKENSMALIKKAFDYSIVDFIERPFNFKDIFLTQTKKNK